MNVNTTLLLSLNQDINILNSLLEDISQTHESDLVNSWLFPSKPSSFVSAIVSNKSLKSFTYEKCLEITLDRLYVLLNFTLSYLNNSKAPTNALIEKPRKLTLGTCVKSLWDNIVKLMEKQITKQAAITTGNNKDFVDKQSQTEIISLNKCDSCSSAILCMKQLLKSFDNHQNGINIKYQIFDITQFGCMLKVTSSIEDALSKLYNELHGERTEKRTLKSENDNYKVKLHEKDAKIAFLEEEVNVLRKQLEKTSEETVKLKQNKCKLSQETIIKKNKIDALTTAVENCNVCIQALTKENDSLKINNDLLKSNIEKSLQLLIRYNTKVKKKLEMMDEEFDIIRSIIEQYENSILGLNMKLAKIMKNLGKTELKLRSGFDDCSEISQNISKYQTFCIKIKELFKEKMDNIKNPPLMQIKGNPVEDIAKQIEENNNKMENLQNENSNLLKLLERFKNIKLIK